jgi:hypothetical protein
VAEYDRQDERIVPDGHIRVADAGGRDAHEDFIRARLVEIQFFLKKRLPFFPKNGC